MKIGTEQNESRRETPNTPLPDIEAVRTTDAKLITYRGEADWTELHDLSADPYETKNLADDPAKQELRRQLEQEIVISRRDAVN